MLQIKELHYKFIRSLIISDHKKAKINKIQAPLEEAQTGVGENFKNSIEDALWLLLTLCAACWREKTDFRRVKAKTNSKLIRKSKILLFTFPLFSYHQNGIPDK